MRIDYAQRTTVTSLGEDFWRIVIHFGFVEIPNVYVVLGSIKELDLSAQLGDAVYFGTRDLILPRPGSLWVARLRVPMFAFLYRNAAKVVNRFHFPPENIVEIARQIESESAKMVSYR